MEETSQNSKNCFFNRSQICITLKNVMQNIKIMKFSQNHWSPMYTVPAFVDWWACTTTLQSGLRFIYNSHHCTGSTSMYRTADPASHAERLQCTVKQEKAHIMDSRCHMTSGISSTDNSYNVKALQLLVYLYC